jgi:hypothetical protein
MGHLRPPKRSSKARPEGADEVGGESPCAAVSVEGAGAGPSADEGASAGADMEVGAGRGVD